MEKIGDTSTLTGHPRRSETQACRYGRIHSQRRQPCFKVFVRVVVVVLKIVVTLTKKGGGERRRRFKRFIGILRISGTFYLWYDRKYENYVTLN